MSTLKITAIKDNKFIHGKVSEVAEVVGCTDNNLRQQIALGKHVHVINDFIIYFKRYE
jgi:hypothetical protein